jgi:hypothetical protein
MAKGQSVMDGASRLRETDGEVEEKKKKKKNKGVREIGRPRARAR